MKILKRWDQKLNWAWQRVGRGKKLALNLTLCALIGVMIWIRLGCPLPTAELEFRRLEHTHLLPESEIVFQTKLPVETFQLEDGPEIRLNGRWFVGLREDRVTLCAMERYTNEQWGRFIVSLPREEGPVLVPLLRKGKYLEPMGWRLVQFTENDVETEEYLVFLLLDPPEGLDRAELTVRSEKEEFSGQGWRMEDGNWLLCLESDLLGRSTIPYQNVSYTLRLFAEDGTLLLERDGDFKDA